MENVTIFIVDTSVMCFVAHSFAIHGRICEERTKCKIIYVYTAIFIASHAFAAVRRKLCCNFIPKLISHFIFLMVGPVWWNIIAFGFIYCLPILIVISTHIKREKERERGRKRLGFLYFVRIMRKSVVSLQLFISVNGFRRV